MATSYQWLLCFLSDLLSIWDCWHLALGLELVSIINRIYLKLLQWAKHAYLEMKDWLLWRKPLLLQFLTLTVLAPNFLREMTVNHTQSSWSSDYQWLRRHSLHLRSKIVTPSKKKDRLYIKAFWHLHSLAEDIHVYILPVVAISDMQEAFLLWILTDFSVGTLRAQKVTGFPLRKKNESTPNVSTLVSPVGFPRELEAVYLSFVNITQGGFSAKTVLCTWRYSAYSEGCSEMQANRRVQCS